MKTKDDTNIVPNLDEIGNKSKEITKELENNIKTIREEGLAILKKRIEMVSEKIISTEESLKEIDQKRNNHSKYTPEELQGFNRIYENTKEFKEKEMRKKEELKKQYNELKNTEIG